MDCLNLFIGLINLNKSFTVSSPQTVPHSLPPEKFRATLLALMQKSQDFNASSRDLITLVKAQNPEIVKKLEEFCARNAQKMALWQAKNWARLKAELGIGMKTLSYEGQSFEEFRIDAVNAVIEFCFSVLKEMGVQNPGFHSATGTPGYASDIDSVYIAPPDMSHCNQIMEKLMFDLTWNGFFKGIPGDQADVEAYLQHPGEVLQTEKAVISIKGKARLVRLEMTMASLQMLRACGKDLEKWKFYKEDQLERAFSEEVKRVLVKIFKEVEAFEGHIGLQIKKQIIKESGLFPEGTEDRMGDSILKTVCAQIVASSPIAEKRASMSYKMPHLLRISKQMDRDVVYLKEIYKRIERCSFEKGSYARSVYLNKMHKEAEKVELRLAMRAAIRNCFFDGTYLTQGAFKKVCLFKNGQIHQRQKEQLQHRLAEHCRHPLSDLIGFHTGVYQRIQPTPSDMLACQQENLSMYVAHFGQRSETEPEEAYQNALVDCSKYSERIMASGVDLLAELARMQPTKTFSLEMQALEKEAAKFHFQVLEIEKCKRKFVLNSTAFKELLYKELAQENISADKKAALEKAIEELAQMGEPGGHLFNELTITHHDRMLLMVSRLTLAGYITPILDKAGNLAAENAKVNAILRARCGFPIFETQQQKEKKIRVENRDLSEVHAKAVQITLQNFGFTTKKSIETFNKDLVRLSTEIANLAEACGLVPQPALKQHAHSSLLELWLSND